MSFEGRLPRRGVIAVPIRATSRLPSPEVPMARHLADHPAPEDGSLRLARFLRLAREEGRHPAIRLLHARRPAASAEGRLAPMLRMLRRRFP